MQPRINKSNVGLFRLVLLSSICLLSASVFATTTCQTMAGSWDFPGYSSTITQDSSGNMSVTVTETPCGDGIGPCTYTGTGTMNLTSNTFSFSVSTTEQTLIDGPIYFGLIYPQTMAYSGTIQTGGCNDVETSNITDTFSSSCASWLETNFYVSPTDAVAECAQYSSDDPQEMTAACTLPSGSPSETTVSTLFWDTSGGAAWNQTLQPTTFNFGGRSVSEATAVDGTDNCYFPLSNFAPLDHVTSPLPFTWNVDASNVWGSDYVGYSEAAVDYYRSNSRVPCGTRFQQTMSIDCHDSPTTRAYITNDLGSDITSTSVSSIRAGSTVYNTTW
jgi:hypothetical protein